MDEELVLVLFQEDKELTCPRGCCREGHVPSRLALQLAAGRGHAAELITDFMTRDDEDADKADRAVLVFRDWADAVGCARGGHEPNTEDGTSAIRVPYYRPDGEWVEEEQDRAYELENWLRAEVDRLLRDRITRERERKAREAAEKNALAGLVRRQEELRRLAELKAKYPEGQ